MSAEGVELVRVYNTVHEEAVQLGRELLAYLRQQLDPLDQMHPRYTSVHAQIDAVTKRLADLEALRLPPMSVTTNNVTEKLR